MNYVDLPAIPGVIRGFTLRIEAAKAISQLETAARNGAQISDASSALSAFFYACAQGAALAADPPQAPQPQGNGGKAKK